MTEEVLSPYQTTVQWEIVLMRVGKMYYKAFQCDQNDVNFSIIALICQKLFQFFRPYTKV